METVALGREKMQPGPRAAIVKFTQESRKICPWPSFSDGNLYRELKYFANSARDLFSRRWWMACETSVVGFRTAY